MAEEQLTQSLLNFIENSPTPFHATSNLEAKLKHRGFIGLDEADKWELEKGQKYYVKRNDSSIIAFKMASESPEETGFRILGAHTDSPGLKIKPLPELKFRNYVNLGVEVYGGPLLNTWYDRDLALAGRISYIDKEGHLSSSLVDFHYPLAILPSLAIHLDRNANENRTINKQNDLPPLVFQLDDDKKEVDFKKVLLEQVELIHPELEADKILDYELFFYDFQPPSVVGMKQQFYTAARIDNLLSCYLAMKAFADSSDDVNSILVCNDHEECGSTSLAGANGSFLKDVLTRICGGSVELARAAASSYLISCDNAHAVHPNFKDKHDANHGPLLNGGPVIKTNANQRYATTCETSGLIMYLAEKDNIPVQHFVARGDMGCGSTIGPMSAAELGVKTIDIGVPTFGMHSIRETAGTLDASYLFKLLTAFLEF